MKIGFQGDIGSNAEAATIEFIKLKGYKDCEMLPLLNSENCVEKLKDGEVNLIVLAIENSTVGLVIETQNALKNQNLTLLSKITIPIHHCLFKKKGVDIKNINTVASHIQALNQTKNSISKIFANINYKEMEDTALSAKYLCEGVIGNNCAVICSLNAGMLYNLDLIKENIEDFENNKTTFGLYKM